MSITADDLKPSKGAKPQEWLVKGLIPQNMLVLLKGRPGAGKSWILRAIAVSAAENKKLFGEFDCKQCSKIIYIDEDTPGDKYEEDLEKMSQGEISDKIIQYSKTGFNINIDNHRLKIRQEILDSNGPVLVLIDCLNQISPGSDLDRSKNVSEIMKKIKEFQEEGATVVLVHHTSTHTDTKVSLGSTYIESNVDCYLNIESLDPTIEGLFNIDPKGKRVSLMKPFSVELKMDPDGLASIIKLPELSFIPTEDEKRIFKKFSDNTIIHTVKSMSDLSGRDLPDNRIRIAFDKLVDQLCLTRVDDPKSSKRITYYTRHPNFNSLSSMYKSKL
jgi:archaellum biogenesis ATPase FlaH